MQRKLFLKCLGLTVGTVAVPAVLTACGGGGDAAILPALSAEEIAGLYYMREEEKLAHDVYLNLYDRWGAQVFANIAESETAHTEAVRQLILAHGL